jgi:dsDNA-binding SOS-regulon protein
MADLKPKTADIPVGVITSLLGLGKAADIATLDERVTFLTKRVGELSDQVDELITRANKLFGDTISERIEFQLADAKKIIETVLADKQEKEDAERRAAETSEPPKPA